MIFRIATLIAFSLVMFAGGKPNQGTKADGRLKENKAKPTVKPAPTKKAGK